MLVRLVLALSSCLAAGTAGAETCRFDGTSSHDGRITARSEVTEAGGLVTVDVALTFSVSTWLADLRYLSQEISTWRGGVLQSVAVNNRTVIDGRITRQQWDVIERRVGSLVGRRVQARSLEAFARRHPRFVAHWPLDAFGQDWLRDYAAAEPETRPDLGLSASALAAGLRTPLALAFYWSRSLPASGGTAPVFMPGFKHDALMEVTYGAATAGAGWRRWRTALHYSGLEGAPSVMTAWVSGDGTLLQLAADVHARRGSGQALVRAEGCQGVPVRPEPPL